MHIANLNIWKRLEKNMIKPWPTCCLRISRFDRVGSDDVEPWLRTLRDRKDRGVSWSIAGAASAHTSRLSHLVQV